MPKEFASLTPSSPCPPLFPSPSRDAVFDGTNRSAWEGVRERRAGGCLKRSGHTPGVQVCGGNV